MAVTAILLAGGSGTRTGADRNKVLLPAGDRPLLQWSLETLEACDEVDEVLLVIREEDRSDAEALAATCAPSKLRGLVPGGASRHASEAAGIRALASDIRAGRIAVVAVHDAARPLASAALTATTVATARAVGGAVPALPLPAPVVRADDDRTRAVEVGALRRVQTPQAFRADALLAAYEAADAEGTQGADTAETVLRHSHLTVRAVPGEERNRKVTFAEDLDAVVRAAGPPASR